MVKHELNIKDSGKNVIWNGVTYKSDGRIVYLPEAVAIFNPIENEIIEETKTDWKQLADDAGIKGEELKKFMKKNESQRQIQLDKLKEV